MRGFSVKCRYDVSVGVKDRDGTGWKCGRGWDEIIYHQSGPCINRRTVGHDPTGTPTGMERNEWDLGFVGEANRQHSENFSQVWTAESIESHQPGQSFLLRRHVDLTFGYLFWLYQGESLQSSLWLF